MAQLPNLYYVTPSNPEPPLVHFAIPIVDVAVLYEYAEIHGLTTYLLHLPHIVSPVTLLFVAQHLSKRVRHKITFGWPLGGDTADCDVFLGLYDNYMMEKMQGGSDRERLVRMVQEALGLDPSVRPRWYLDMHTDLLKRDSDESD